MENVKGILSSKVDGKQIFHTILHDLADPDKALSKRKAAAAGYDLINLGAEVAGEARDVAHAHAAMALEAKRAGRKAVILSGGELTVTIRGHGAGGPNQEYALALALALEATPGIVALAGDTDGTDGGGGRRGAGRRVGAGPAHAHAAPPGRRHRS